MTSVGSMSRGMLLIIPSCWMKPACAKAARRFLMMADDLHEALELKGESNGKV